ncbi:MAG: hypothetical protein GYA34_14650 [Chloroflexi bacterium]|nr:hypothetical protein [Chloroflexota bacterium]
MSISLNILWVLLVYIGVIFPATNLLHYTIPLNTTTQNRQEFTISAAFTLNLENMLRTLVTAWSD